MGEAHNLRIHCTILIQRAVHADSVGSAWIFSAFFDVAVFATKVSHAVVVSGVDFGCAYGINIIPAQAACVIVGCFCLGGLFLALRKPAIILGIRGLI